MNRESRVESVHIIAINRWNVKDFEPPSRVRSTNSALKPPALMGHGLVVPDSAAGRHVSDHVSDERTGRSAGIRATAVGSAKISTDPSLAPIGRRRRHEGTEAGGATAAAAARGS